ncbi:MAG: carotenoid oxygenase family protein [Caulobacter sp.]|nr:carotenoid oxygenase family protein [Caulobacter sp.]
MDRRAFLTAAAAAGLAQVVTPEQAFARAAASQPAWSLAVGDVMGDIPRQSLRRIHGKPPAGLAGTLYRNGPARFRRPGGDATHWFDGDGLVRAFRIGPDDASLEAKFVDTFKRRQDAAARAVITPGFGTLGSDRAVIGSADDTNAANTALLPIGGELLALWEAGSPYSVDPATLETRGLKTFSPELAHMPFLAHPRIEPGGRVWNLGLAGRRAIVWTLAPSGAVERTTLVDLPRASFIHDFTATDRHLVIVLQPLIQDRMVLPFVDAFSWRPEEGTQVLVLDKDDLSRRRLYDLPAFFFFHLGDAWAEADGTVRFDACLDSTPDFAVHGARDILTGKPAPNGVSLAMVALHPDGRAELNRTPLTAEFPRADPRRAGLSRSKTIINSVRTQGRPLLRGVGVSDWRTGKADLFDYGPDHCAEELLFVPRPGDGNELGGWLVGTSLNLKARATELHVFDAAHVSDGPLCSWRAEVGLPVGFHGAWVGG